MESHLEGVGLSGKLLLGLKVWIKFSWVKSFFCGARVL